jgi:hypothetical protein
MINAKYEIVVTRTDNVPIGVVWYSPNGKYDYVNLFKSKDDCWLLTTSNINKILSSVVYFGSS